MEGGAIPQSATVFVEDGWWAEGGFDAARPRPARDARPHRAGILLRDPRAGRSGRDGFLPPTPPHGARAGHVRHAVLQPPTTASSASGWMRSTRASSSWRRSTARPARSGGCASSSTSPMEHDCVHYWEYAHADEKARAVELARRYERTLFLVAAGPMANVLIHTMFGVNPTNRYLDVGSALDELVHGRRTRPYMHLGTDDSGARLALLDGSPSPPSARRRPPRSSPPSTTSTPTTRSAGERAAPSYYLASLRSLAKMKAPFVVYTWPRARRRGSPLRARRGAHVGRRRLRSCPRRRASRRSRRCACARTIRPCGGAIAATCSASPRCTGWRSRPA